jgi:CheY-like chemotaxis protein
MITILVADDCANIRRLLSQEFEEEGYRVLVARDGKEAVEVVRREHPHVAILDIWMPRVNGLEAAAHIADLDAGIPIILYTNNDELCIGDTRSAYATACLEKSNDLTELKRTVVSVLARRNGGPPLRLGLPPIPGRSPGTPGMHRSGASFTAAHNR